MIRRVTGGSSLWTTLFWALLLAGALFVFLGRILPWHPYWLWLAASNGVALLLFGVDKWQARRRRGRAPEIVLFFFALAGGFVGALLGRHLFRHKTKRAAFGLVPLLGALLHLLGYFVLWGPTL